MDMFLVIFEELELLLRELIRLKSDLKRMSRLRMWLWQPVKFAFVDGGD